MNHNNLIPRRIHRRNPSWLLRCARCIGRLRKLALDYRFFRSRGFTRRSALFNAQNTIARGRQ